MYYLYFSRVRSVRSSALVNLQKEIKMKYDEFKESVIGKIVDDGNGGYKGEFDIS